MHAYGVRNWVYSGWYQVNSRAVFVVYTVVNQSGNSGVCSSDSACTMRHDGKHLYIAKNDFDKRSVSTDVEDQSSSVESWLQEGNMDAIRAMTGKGYFGVAVEDSTNGDSDVGDLHGSQAQATSPAGNGRLVHWNKPRPRDEYCRSRSNTKRSADHVGNTAAGATCAVGAKAQFEWQEQH